MDMFAACRCMIGTTDGRDWLRLASARPPLLAVCESARSGGEEAHPNPPTRPPSPYFCLIVLLVLLELHLCASLTRYQRGAEESAQREGTPARQYRPPPAGPPARCTPRSALKQQELHDHVPGGACSNLAAGVLQCCSPAAGALQERPLPRPVALSAAARIPAGAALL
ncbi:hypothetical protein EJ04DRAFT_602294 [Polyplosphaeria fusca]|uniref:Uncharacterized protein n=1 Tax=Polyplosphaeria fusca TaxID=682080 RepID=A0A9P4QY63_9PLEO|nr:hypothetical protein EJ04DRAFT_602294 [Polyplosphaeria fusca]